MGVLTGEGRVRGVGVGGDKPVELGRRRRLGKGEGGKGEIFRDGEVGREGRS